MYRASKPSGRCGWNLTAVSAISMGAAYATALPFSTSADGATGCEPTKICPSARMDEKRR
jgi:hypothetical protein